ncbi:VWFA-related domain-containing protein [Bryocella elongata]|uniref:VWFA-related domain-containing protein n=1 Tax=Bryocella elongata TaxID=863522 RepID=A0A1H6BG11_9BACT|nr:VWA domain-containing protein [Bryocella elongata]SEG59176.1 VWFA-related domain-containing protein [Bryocella elongata]
MRLSPWGCAVVLLCALPLGAQESAATTQVLHVDSRLVVVDVTVTDSHGAPVHSLPKSAFKLTESGHAQVLSGVEEHTAPRSPDAAKALPLQPGVFSNVVSATPESAPPTILLIDFLNTPLSSQGWVKEKLLEYLRTAPSNGRTAICVLNTRLVMLQNLTSDPTLLRAALEKAQPRASSTGNGDVDRAFDKTQIPEEARDAFRENPAWTEINEHQRADVSLQGFHQLALYLAGIPGRKNLIWFSSAFPLNLLPRWNRSRGDTQWEKEYRETVDLLTRSRVAIYPVDSRGIEIAPLVTSSRSRTAVDFSDVNVETQSAMMEIADDTGGKAFLNTNGIAQAVANVVAAGSEYYTLTYVPTDAEAHGEYRPIHVEVTPSNGYKLSYRRGYDAVVADHAVKAEAKEVADSTVKAAAAFLAPPSTQIGFFARVLPVGGGEVGASLRQATDSGRRGPRNGPIEDAEGGEGRRYRIEYSTDLSNLTITSGEDGKHMAHVEFLALAYDAQGRVLRSYSRPLHMTWTAEQFSTAVQHGARYAQEINLPGDGAITLRLFVHDLTSDHLGSLDVPASALKR